MSAPQFRPQRQTGADHLRYRHGYGTARAARRSHRRPRPGGHFPRVPPGPDRRRLRRLDQTRGAHRTSRRAAIAILHHDLTVQDAEFGADGSRSSRRPGSHGADLGGRHGNVARHAQRTLGRRLAGKLQSRSPPCADRRLGRHSPTMAADPVRATLLKGNKSRRHGLLQPRQPATSLRHPGTRPRASRTPLPASNSESWKGLRTTSTAPHSVPTRNTY